MAMRDTTTAVKGHDEALEKARLESDAAYALKQLGDLVRLSNDGNAGFEGMSDRHWTAIGIAIEQLSERLYSGSISSTLETINDAKEA